MLKWVEAQQLGVPIIIKATEAFIAVFNGYFGSPF